MQRVHLHSLEWNLIEDTVLRWKEIFRLYNFGI